MNPVRILALCLAAVALVAAVVIAAAALWQFGPSLTQPTAPAPAPVVTDTPVQPSAEEQTARERDAALMPLLFQSEADHSSPIVVLPLTKPETFCKGLEAMGLKAPVFQVFPPPARGWTCIPDILKPVEGDEAVVSSLFVTVRGEEADRVSQIRLKLNLLDPASAATVRVAAQDLLRRMMAALGGEAAPQALAAIDGLSDGVIRDHGVVYDLRREFGDERRVNLIVTFPPALGQGLPDRFTPVRRDAAPR